MPPPACRDTLNLRFPAFAAGSARPGVVDIGDRTLVTDDYRKRLEGRKEGPVYRGEWWWQFYPDGPDELRLQIRSSDGRERVYFTFRLKKQGGNWRVDDLEFGE